MILKVALVATNSLLSSQLIVGIISVLHEARKPTLYPWQILISNTELCAPTLASIPDLYWFDFRILYYQCFHELNIASHLPWCLYVVLCPDLNYF